jgi:hypothetical protein
MENMVDMPSIQEYRIFKPAEITIRRKIEGMNKFGL